MKFLDIFLLAVILSTVSGHTTSFKDKVEDLKRAFGAVLDDTSAEIAGLKSQLQEMKEERAELDRAHAWQALHMAAAAACRGSTASGGTGPWGNAVLAKENTRSCNQVCIAARGGGGGG